MKIHQNYPLINNNTFRINELADWFIEINQPTEIMEALSFYSTHIFPNPLLILGAGSNMLFTEPYRGLVLKPSFKGIKIKEDTDSQVVLEVAAGENWDELVGFCVKNNWSGIENLSAIPGTVGAAPVQNIGAYSIEVKNVISSVETFDLMTKTFVRFNANECNFGYRHSYFKQHIGRYIICSVEFCLNKSHEFAINYGDIKAEIGAKPLSVSVIREAICAIRKKKLPNPEELGNAGSFFKNPLVSKELAAQIATHYSNVPQYQDESGMIKLPAAWLIEQCGWKGFRRGDAGVHEKQALVLVNYGQAKGKEILALANEIRNDVHLKFGILLEMEVNRY